ncbi:MAG: SWIM zinc finger family protein [Alicyclobacillus sp.]|nr:SWIM zinc finger family protein [Alicyclobacillus sp.]
MTEENWGGTETTSWSGTWREMMGTLAAFADAGRFERGLAYEANGQVSSLSLSVCSIFAQVRGGRPQPYNVSVQIRPIPAAVWHRLLTRLADQPQLAADLADGRLPNAIDALLAMDGCSLVPTPDEIESVCDCPDWASPCKHAYAVFAATERAIAEHPLQLLTLRGMPQAIWLERVQQAAAVAEAAQSARASAPPTHGRARWIDPDMTPTPWGVHPQTGKPITPQERIRQLAEQGPAAFWYGPPPVGALGGAEGTPSQANTSASQAELAWPTWPDWDPLQVTPTPDPKTQFAVHTWRKPPVALPDDRALETLGRLYQQVSERAAMILQSGTDALRT